MPDFDDPSGWVTIRHPEVGVSPNKVHRSSMASVWTPLGWEVVDDKVAAAVAPDGDLESLGVLDLREIAQARGVDVTKVNKKADLIAAIEKGA